VHAGARVRDGRGRIWPRTVVSLEQVRPGAG
jgi:hypothetical protein